MTTSVYMENKMERLLGHAVSFLYQHVETRKKSVPFFFEDYARYLGHIVPFYISISRRRRNRSHFFFNIMQIIFLLLRSTSHISNSMRKTFGLLHIYILRMGELEK